jgi:hypothetical protein
MGIIVTTTISVSTAVEPDFGIGMGLYQVTTITAGGNEPDPDILDARLLLLSGEQDVHSQAGGFSISALIQRFRTVLPKLSIYILAFFVILGVIIFAFYAAKKHDLGTGSGLCALVWTAGGTAYKICLHDGGNSQGETLEQRGRELRRLA